MTLKKPLEYSEQVQMLQTHGVKIDNKTDAKHLLEQMGYYRLTGYALQFRVNPADSDCKLGTSLNQIVKLYQFDEEIRDLMRKYIERVEVYYKTQIANRFARIKCTEPPYNQHYNEDNYYNKKWFREILDSIKKEKKHLHDSEIVKHHEKKYSGEMPLWVIVELLSFSNVSKLYNCMYYSDKDEIASIFGISRTTLENHLHCLSVLRNKCAHGARLYNTTFSPPAHFASQFLKANPDVKNNTLFAYILVLIKRLPNSESKKGLFDSIVRVVSKYENDIDLNLLGFPKEYVTIMNKICSISL